MTREEAIKGLKVLRRDFSGYKPNEEMFDMAIKALENHDTFMKYAYSQGKQDALSQEPCGDVVSREDAIRKLRADTLFVCSGDKMQAISDIEGLPPVTQSCEKCAMNGSGSKYCDNCGQKYGKWTLMYEPKNMVVCSECGKCAYMYQDKTSAFCPHCGAKMQESEDRNNEYGRCNERV